MPPPATGSDAIAASHQLKPPPLGSKGGPPAFEIAASAVHPLLSPLASLPDMGTDSLPVVDLGPFLASGDTSAAEQVARCLAETGLLLVRDPRVLPADNDLFLDTMERCRRTPALLAGGRGGVLLWSSGGSGGGGWRGAWWGRRGVCVGCTARTARPVQAGARCAHCATARSAVAKGIRQAFS